MNLHITQLNVTRRLAPVPIKKGLDAAEQRSGRDEERRQVAGVALPRAR